MAVEICEPVMLGLTAPSHPLRVAAPFRPGPPRVGTGLNVPCQPFVPLMSWEEHRRALEPGRYPPDLPDHQGRAKVHCSEAGVCVWKVLGSYYVSVGC